MPHRLLLVEDSATQLITIKLTLESSGYTLITAKDGAEGLVRAYDEQPDLIISDIVMSGINGYQLCRLVKNDPELSGTPVILLTKLDGSVDRFWGMKSGADRFIPKEPGFPSLISAVQDLLETRAKEPRLRVINESQRSLSQEEINYRLNQLLERLLFEATIIDEVRKLADESLNIRVITERLFDLLSSVLNYDACALLVNEDTESIIYHDCGKGVDEDSLLIYANQIGLQLGLPPIKHKKTANKIYHQEHALTQPIDIQGSRLGLLVVIPHGHRAYKAGDQKVVRIICEQLSIVLRLYLSMKDSKSNFSNLA